MAQLKMTCNAVRLMRKSLHCKFHHLFSPKLPPKVPGVIYLYPSSPATEGTVWDLDKNAGIPYGCYAALG